MNELFTQPNSSNNQINWNHYKIIAAIYFTQLFHNNNDFSSTTHAIDLSDNLIKKLKKSICDDSNNAKNNNDTDDSNQFNYDQYQISPKIIIKYPLSNISQD